MSKRSQDPPKKHSAMPRKKPMTRRAILASLGIGMAMPALRASGLEDKKKPKRDPDQAFEEYWEKVRVLIEARDKETDPRKKEILELKVEFLRKDVMATVNRSSYSGCIPLGTPTPLPK